ncbi:shikimate dehydrogenase [Demequina aurantiaca]|uniref:shikimate dehydrogenase n=1 Tax=Demequina aurantiaca TaxID=676200 RepID=UPI00078020BB|nr:shikimate dehydrogenase [Demequina aurantiaca]
MTTRRAAVLGHPIAHSLSPVLHNAAYEALGLDWFYDSHDVTEPQFDDFVGALGDEWAGLSLTMPLKVEAVRHMDFVEPMAKLVGAVNTVLIQTTGAGRHLVGANTDVYGIVAALREGGLTRATHGVIVGGGATATSAMAALGQIGVTAPVVAVRDRARAGGLMRAATKMGVAPRFVNLDTAQDFLADAEVAVSTIPADAGETLAGRIAAVASSAVLLDVIYHPLVTPLGARWAELGGVRVGGERMLAHQAGEQVRLMTGKEAPIGQMLQALNAVLN